MRNVCLQGVTLVFIEKGRPLFVPRCSFASLHALHELLLAGCADLWLPHRIQHYISDQVLVEKESCHFQLLEQNAKALSLPAHSLPNASIDIQRVLPVTRKIFLQDRPGILAKQVREALSRCALLRKACRLLLGLHIHHYQSSLQQELSLPSAGERISAYFP